MRSPFIAWTLIIVGLLANSLIAQDFQDPPPIIERPVEPIPAEHEVVFDYPEWKEDNGIAPRYSLRRSFGDGIGYTNGFTYGEAFVPLWINNGHRLFFGDVRVVNFDDSRLWEFNFGAGYRWLNAEQDIVFGVNAFYDARRTNRFTYQQLGVGAEVLCGCWEFRANGYIPVGPQRKQIGITGFFNPQFVGTNISLNQIARFETTMGGFDVEAGRMLPFLQRFRPRAYIGFYHYSNDQVQTANGVQGRLEAWVNDNISLHLAVQNDAVFDTTTTGGLAIHWGGPKNAGSSSVAARLGRRVVRDPNIVIAQQDELRTELAIDPSTGQPIEVRHVNSAAAAGGDGSVENPFNSLAQLQAGSGPNMILFAHAASVFTSQNVTLQNNQRLLGEGIAHQFTATQGTFLLPRATSGVVQPLIRNAMNFGVMLANDTEVSGFNLLAVQGEAIFGMNISNVNINRNLITDTTSNATFDGNAITLLNVSGVNNITQNQIFNPEDDAIDVDLTGTTSSTINIVNNTVHSPQDDSVDIVVEDDTTLNVTISNNSFTQSSENALEVVFEENAQVTAVIQNNRINGTGDDGMFFDVDENTRFTALISGNTFLNLGSDGIDFDNDETSVTNVIIQNNRFEGIGDEGIEVDLDNTSQMIARVLNNQFIDFGDDGIDFDMRSNSVASLQLANNLFRSAGGDAGDIDTQNNSTLCAQLMGNTTNQDFDLNENGGSTFNLEDTLGTNIFQAGAIADVDAAINIVPAGFCGFPNP